MRRFLAISASMLTLLFVVGCSQSSVSDKPRSSQPLWGLEIPAGTKMASAQRSALADGKVTSAEYHEGFRRFSACLAKGGYTVMALPDKNEVLQYGVPAEAGDLYEKCLSREFEWVETVWQLSRADTSNQAKAYAVCLKEKGITPKKTEDAKYAQLEAAHIDPSDCYVRLYPHG
ncbi:hypothetical protein [Glaciihabitans sp. UYNi722]|uniref:hypothetical protein n=1 Tax=Glaciihabitans sp. UYNi722 TaxID=3156344 RepID=UPI00339B2995